MSADHKSSAALWTGMRPGKMHLFNQGGSREVEYLLSDRVQKPRSVFAPGTRIKMNAVPMFLGVFIPWGIYIFCCGLTSFSLNYSNPSLVRGLLALVFAVWVGAVFAAVWTRHRNPDPTWVTYLALVNGIAAIAGTVSGEVSFSTFSGSYYRIRDLRVVSDVDASYTSGQNLLDAGIVHFAPGNHFDDLRTWHFKYGSTWCVAPLVTNRNRDGSAGRVVRLLDRRQGLLLARGVRLPVRRLVPRPRANRPAGGRRRRPGHVPVGSPAGAVPVRYHRGKPGVPDLARRPGGGGDQLGDAGLQAVHGPAQKAS
ncbi:unnamed protein product [Prorocentrum cordatum]|uniref:Uncharacterized protein n=1 Tax=Prorocentrum cordatum TaxID=2364126 RepID=A0ABN9R732_9DINO|nr:unnamed protein product [Polarella glacialis]